LATISPAESSHQETISTLRFLERAKRVVLQSQRNDSFSRLGDDTVSSEAIGKALKQVQDLELQLFVVRRELQASQGENVRLEEQLKLKEINEENNPKAANEPSGDVDAYSEAHKWKEELDYLKLELTSARDQLSVKSIELDCAVETHAHQIREYEQTVADLQDRLRQAVSNELDAVREKNELTNYYTSCSWIQRPSWRKHPPSWMHRSAPQQDLRRRMKTENWSSASWTACAPCAKIIC
jgi:DNA repair exonuclease SbcCD ATPase subunit